jgi:hypothetical protein
MWNSMTNHEIFRTISKVFWLSQDCGRDGHACAWGTQGIKPNRREYLGHWFMTMVDVNHFFDMEK